MATKSPMWRLASRLGRQYVICGATLLCGLFGCSDFAHAVDSPLPSVAPPAVALQNATGGVVQVPPTKQRFGFADGVIRLVGHGEVSGRAVFVADQMDKELADQPLERIVDDAEGERAIVTFAVDKASELQRSGMSRSWVVRVSVVGLDINAQQTRYARVKLGSFETKFGYVITNRPAMPMDFGVSVRPQWLVDPDHLATAVVIETRDQPVSGLRVSLSTLSEQSSSIPIETQALELCPSPSGECGAINTVPAQNSRTLYLRLKDKERRSGVFKGNVSLASDSRSESKVFPLDVLSSSLCIQVLGGVVIVGSVLLAWFVNVRGRLLISRLSALQIATVAREKIEGYLLNVHDFERVTDLKFKLLEPSMVRAGKALTEKTLGEEGALPSAMSYYKAFDDTKFKAAMATAEAIVKAVAILVHDGVEVLRTRCEAADDNALRDRIKQAAAKLDVDVESLKDEAEARSAVNAALAVLNPATLGADEWPKVLQAQRESERIVAQIELANRSAWLVYLLLISVAGIATLILRSPGFGTWLDFAYCVFWGFGLPTATDKLQQLTPTGVATTIGVTLPK